MADILVPPKDENVKILLCWRNPTFTCDESCSAFDERALNDDRFRPCLLLNVQRQQANALVKLASEVQRWNNDNSKASARREEETSKVVEYFEKFRKQMEHTELPPPPEIKL